MKLDVGVVGAGPAGAWMAYCLARRGVRVTLFDPSHPREKVCGGGVTGRALALVKDAVDPSRLMARVIASARFTDVAHGDTATLPLEGRGISSDSALIVARRTDFDAMLLAAACRAGADIEPARVLDVVARRGEVTLETTGGRRRADFIVGADGANSLVRRRFVRPFRRDELSIATGYFAHGVTSNEIIIAFVADPPGYIWSFPRPDHLAVGICAQADSGVRADTLRQRVAAWISATGIADGARLEPYSWPVPSLPPQSLEDLEVAGAGWCLIGDAAGLVDPVTREGIYFALASAQAAADALTTPNASHKYTERAREEIIPELIWAARIKASFFSPWSTGLMIRALRESAAVRGVVADLVAGRQAYAGLKWRLLKTCEIRLVWRLLVNRRPGRPAL